MRATDIRGIGLGVAVGIAAAGYGAETTAPLFHSAGTDSITITRDPATGGAMTRQVAVNHHQVLYTMPGERDVIVRETITSGYLEATEDGEGGEAFVELFFRRPDQSYPAAPDHATTVPEASRVEFNHDHWTAAIVGCCDAQPILQLFGYGEGKPFLYSNTPYAQAILPNANITRYAGTVLRGQVYIEPVERAIFGNNDRAIGAVFYGTAGKPLQKHYLYPAPGASESQMPYRVESITLKSGSPKDEPGYNENPSISHVVNLWSQDTVPNQPPPTTLSNITITATYLTGESTTQTVTIPVEKDKFGQAKVTGNALMVGAE